MRPVKHSIVVRIIWLLLLIGGAWAIYGQNWTALFVTALTFALTFAPFALQRYYHVQFPVVFSSAIIVFTYSTLLLGELGNFYERYWWWDVVLHGGSAIGFGLVGFVFILMLFKGDRFAAPPLAMSWIAFSFGMTIGVVWEFFEFGMDQFFGLNMQKSGIVDTMYDLMVDAVGAGLGSAGGYFYLKGQKFGGLAKMIEEFVRENRGLFKNNKD